LYFIALNLSVAGTASGTPDPIGPSGDCKFAESELGRDDDFLINEFDLLHDISLGSGELACIAGTIGDVVAVR